MAPSYRSICIAIMKNDYSLSTLGYSKLESEAYNMLKQKEIADRERNSESGQMRLF